MAYTNDDLAAVDAAIKNSELEVDIDGQRVRYRSIDELLKARAHIAGQLQSSGARGARAGANYRYSFVTSRGE